jgi:UDP-N-acetylmuramoyl-tripeptide--D-alanyl-D-alanine ligase
VKRRLADLPEILRTPIGRKQLWWVLNRKAWPLARRVAWLHRRTIARRTRVVVVIGSYGKSTTTRVVGAALGVHGRHGANAFTGVARNVLRIRPWHRHAVLEVGIDRPGQMDAYAKLLRPDIVVVTSIGVEHGRSFASLDATRDEKARMVQALQPAGLAVLNGDDPRVASMAAGSHAPAITFGVGASCDVRASEIELDWPIGTRVTVEAGDGSADVRIQLLGRPGVDAVLAGAAVGLAEGIALNRLLARVATVSPTPGRLQPVRLESGAYVLRDYFKSSFETISVALDLLEQLPARRKVVVFGDVTEPPGSQGPIYRALGERIARVADRAVLAGTQGRDYALGARRAGMPAHALVKVGASFREAAEAAGRDLGPGDVLLVKGRDNERLDRVSLLLQGREVRCELIRCTLRNQRCETCAMLERGWEGRRWRPG